MQDRYRVCVRLNEPYRGKKYKLGEIEVVVTAKDTAQARRKAKTAVARKLFKTSNLAVEDIEKIPRYL